MLYFVLTRSVTESPAVNFRLTLVHIFASYQAFTFAMFPLSYRYYMLLKWVIHRCTTDLLQGFRNEKPSCLWSISVASGTAIAPIFQVTLMHFVLIPFVDKLPHESSGFATNSDCKEGARVPLFLVKDTVKRQDCDSFLPLFVSFSLRFPTSFP